MSDKQAERRIPSFQEFIFVPYQLMAGKDIVLLRCLSALSVCEPYTDMTPQQIYAAMKASAEEVDGTF